MMKYVALTVSVWCVTAVPMVAQMIHANGPLPSFEVATVKPWQPSTAPVARVGETGVPQKVMKMAPTGGGGQATDRVHFIGQAEILIEVAYGLPVGAAGRVVGTPDWVRSEGSRYEVSAKIEESAFAAMQKMTAVEQREQVALMEQSLLAERFGLKTHFETKEMPVYELVVAKGGPKLTPARAGEASRLSTLDSEQGSEVTAQALTLETFIHSPLMRVGGRPVLDKTGLLGSYDFVLKTAAGQPGMVAGDDDSLSVFGAVQEQLGLRLVSTKGPVEVLVIDHIDRPSAN